ncbi:MAG: methyltransferase [Patescibacteria group bacterium]
MNTLSALKRLRLFFRVFLFEKLFLGVIARSGYERIWHIIGGHIFFHTLVTSVEVGLFDLLHTEGALTQTQIAEKLHLEQKPVRILLLGLTSLRLLDKTGDRYALTYLSHRYFVSSSPFNIRAVLAWQKRINYKAMFHLTEAVEQNTNVGLMEFAGTERTLYERLEHTPDLNQIFQDAMRDISKQAATQLAEYLDTSGSAYLVDVGGGNGTVLMSLARKNPRLRGAVMDLASIEAISTENIRHHGFTDTLEFVPGNCFSDPFPKKADMLLFCHFFTIWSEEKNTQLLKKCYEALPAGGKVVLFNMMQRDTEDGPLSAAMGSPYFLTLATGEGMLYCWRDYERWMRAVGFTKIQKFVLPTDHGIIVAEK